MARDKFASKPIHEDDPLLYEELLRFKFNFDCFEHLDGLNDHWERLLGNHRIVHLEKEQVNFESALDFRGQLDSVRNLVGPILQKALLIDHMVRVFELVRVHVGDPHDKSHVVALHLRGEESIFGLEFGAKE